MQLYDNSIVQLNGYQRERRFADELKGRLRGPLIASR